MDYSDDTIRKIREALIAEALQSTGFISEREFARRFNLSRYVTKKVLIALEGEGLLRCLPQRGYEVVDYTHSDGATMQKMRSVLEADAVRAAAQNATREDLVRLTLILEELDELNRVGDAEAYRTRDFEFHQALVAASHDAMFIKLFDALLALRYSTRPAVPGLLDLAQADHTEILAAVKAKNADAAERAMLKHLGGGLRIYMHTLSTLEDNFIRRELMETERLLRESDQPGDQDDTNRANRRIDRLTSKEVPSAK